MQGSCTWWRHSQNRHPPEPVFFLRRAVRQTSELQNDDELIFQNAGTGRGIVVTKMELWFPKLMLSPEGQVFVNANFLKLILWIYLQETLIDSGTQRDAGGQVEISPGVKNAKLVFGPQ